MSAIEHYLGNGGPYEVQNTAGSSWFSDTVKNCNIDWPNLNNNAGLYWWLTHPVYPVYTPTYVQIPPELELSAVCKHCERREKLLFPQLPQHWIKLNYKGKDETFCSHKCVAKYCEKIK